MVPLTSPLHKPELSQEFLPKRLKRPGSVMEYFRIVSHYIYNDVKRNQTNFKIGMMTIFLMVSSLTVLSNLI